MTNWSGVFSSRIPLRRAIMRENDQPATVGRGLSRLAATARSGQELGHRTFGEDVTQRTTLSPRCVADHLSRVSRGYDALRQPRGVEVAAGRGEGVSRVLTGREP